MASVIAKEVNQLVGDELKREANKNDDFDEQSNYESLIFEACDNENYDRLKSIITELEEDFNMNMSESRNFIDLQQNESVDIAEANVTGDPITPSQKLSLKKDAMAAEGDSLVLKIDESIKWKDLWNLEEELWEDLRKKVFIVGNQQKWEGRITSKMEETKDRWKVFEAKGKSSVEYWHFGQSKNSKKETIASQSVSFFRYEFLTDTNETMTLLSTEELDTGNCIIRGTKMTLSDAKQIGENTKASTDKEVVFVYSSEPAVKPIDKERLREMRRDVDHNWLARNLLGDFRHPRWFEELLLVILMNKDQHGFPSHFIWLAESGTGKTTVMECITKAFNESYRGMNTGSSTTVKGLTPSHAGESSKAGALLETHRVCAIDEIFNLLKKSQANKSNAKEDIFRDFQDILEHKERNFRSGNADLRGKMDSTLICAANPSFGVGSIYEATQELSNPFLSRFLMYEQTDAHTAFVNDKKGEVNEQDKPYPSSSPVFIALMDHLREEELVKVDPRRIREIHNTIGDTIPSSFKEVWLARGKKHISNLASGHAKYRSIVGGSLDFQTIEEDYRWAKQMMERIVSTWKVKPDKENMPLHALPQHLNDTKRKVYRHVENNYPVKIEELKELFEKSMDFHINKLKEMGLVKSKGRKDDKEYYPYWAEEVRSSEDHKKFVP